MIIRTAFALVAMLTALAMAWVAVWGVLVTGWMPGATPVDLAWRWFVALLSLAVGASSLTLVVVAVGLLAEPVRSVYDWASRRV